MANLIGYLRGRTQEVHRLGNDTIEAQLETWNGAVRVVLAKDGEFTVTIGQKGSPQKVVYEGNCEPDKQKKLEVREG